MRSFIICFITANLKKRLRKNRVLDKREIRLVGKTGALGFPLSHGYYIAPDQIIEYLLAALLD